jgi:hypothetical protein
VLPSLFPGSDRMASAHGSDPRVSREVVSVCPLLTMGRLHRRFCGPAGSLTRNPRASRLPLVNASPGISVSALSIIPLVLILALGAFLAASILFGVLVIVVLANRAEPDRSGWRPCRSISSHVIHMFLCDPVRHVRNSSWPGSIDRQSSVVELRLLSRGAPDRRCRHTSRGAERAGDARRVTSCSV